MNKAIILNGTLGSGKTTIARAVNQKVSESVHVEGDGFLWRNPWPKDSNERCELLLPQLQSIISFWKEQNIKLIVFSYLMPETFFIKKVESVFEELGFKTSTFTFFPRKELLHKRIVERNRMGKPEFEILPANEMNELLLKQEYVGNKVEVDELHTVDKIVDIIFRKIEKG